MATEINRLIKSLLQVQQDREDKSVIMRVSNVRVTRVDCSPYYGTVVFSGGAIAIEADDLKTGDMHFRPGHFIGFQEEGNRAIVLRQYNGEEIFLHFRTERQMTSTLRRIRQLFGYTYSYVGGFYSSESTSESSASSSDEATQSSTATASTSSKKR